MAIVTLVLGGARSGKSSFAEKVVTETGLPKLYIATAEFVDDEMKKRIARHRDDRASAGWETVEAPINIVDHLSDSRFLHHAVLIDCLTLWLGNLLHYKKNISKHKSALLTFLNSTNKNITLVSNEVGLGIVPESSLAREFRDEAGKLHQNIAELADRVVLMVAGIPMFIKGDNINA